LDKRPEKRERSHETGATEKQQNSTFTFLAHLNEKQKQAATMDIERPLAIIAAAGSGKTSTLCSRIAYILSKGIQPYFRLLFVERLIQLWHQGVPAFRILALTFTRAAAEELKKRIRLMVESFPESQPQCLKTSTFHSFCLSILRVHAKKFGYNELSICSESQQVNPEWRF